MFIRVMRMQRTQHRHLGKTDRTQSGHSSSSSGRLVAVVGGSSSSTY